MWETLALISAAVALAAVIMFSPAPGEVRLWWRLRHPGPPTPGFSERQQQRRIDALERELQIGPYAPPPPPLPTPKEVIMKLDRLREQRPLTEQEEWQWREAWSAQLWGHP